MTNSIIIELQVEMVGLMFDTRSHFRADHNWDACAKLEWSYRCNQKAPQCEDTAPDHQKAPSLPAGACLPRLDVMLGRSR